METLNLAERIDLSVKIGESQYREFKSAYEGRPGDKIPRSVKDIMQDVAKTLVAFANADGGELLIGVEDDGSITGVPHQAGQIAAILASSETHVHQETPLPTPRKGSIFVSEKTVIYFYVPKGTHYVHLTADGRCLQRIDRDTQPMSSEFINATRLEDGSRSWDRHIAPGATIADLDLDIIASVAAQITYGVSVEKCLQYLDLAEFGFDGLILKKAATILFAKDIKTWHPGCQVRIMTVNGKEKRSGENFNITRDEMISDNILRLIDSAWERLNVALMQQTYLTDQAQFKQSFLYPQIACREALINAIVHRNYAIEGRGIEISIYSDRMEILSPGMLLSTISLEDLKSLKGVHDSRNPLIARVLREVGFVREMGEGIRRIYDVMRSNALAEPHIETDSSGFSVTLYHKSMYDPKVKLWLSNFEKYKLTENQMAIIALGFEGNLFSTQDIIDRLGIVDTDQIREFLTPLRAQRLIERALSDKQAMQIAREKRIPKREVKLFQVADRPVSIRYEEMEFNSTEVIMNDASDPDALEYEIFIGKLPYYATKQDVYDIISAETEVLSISIPSGRAYGSVNKGFAFVKISYKGNIQNLLARLKGKTIGERHINVSLSRR